MTRRQRAALERNAIVLYLRVSTDAQGESGLGLDAQLKTGQEYATSTGRTIDSTFTEIESGKRPDRPELAKAMDRARRIGARLVVAKLDRLARNARFLLGIVESDVEVAFCDLPNIPPGPAGKFILTNMAAAAELEAGLISERTKSALKAYKARGGLLGASLPQCRNLTDEGRERGSKAGAAKNRAIAIAEDADLSPEMLRMEQSGKSLRQIAKTLNDEGQATRMDGKWSHIQVGRILDRAYGPKDKESGLRPRAPRD